MADSTRYSFKEIKAMMAAKHYGNGRVIKCELEVWNDKPARLIRTVEYPILRGGEIIETETQEVTSVL